MIRSLQEDYSTKLSHVKRLATSGAEALGPTPPLHPAAQRVEQRGAHQRLDRHGQRRLLPSDRGEQARQQVTTPKKTSASSPVNTV
jgi:hypothetical protein